MSEAKPLSKNAQKRMEKERRRQAQKDARRAAQQEASGGVARESKQKAEDREAEMSESEYYDLRKRQVVELEAKGVNCYPHKFPVNCSIPEFRRRFAHVSAGERLDDSNEVCIAGRVMVKRSHGKLIFYDVHGDDAAVQVMADRKFADDENAWEAVHERSRRGDIVGVRGVPARSKKGELSIVPREFIILSPCLRILPSQHFGLKDQEMRYRQRYLDLIMNPGNRRIFYTRAKIISYIRRFFDARGFLEVETPMMTMIAGGAAARPFVTHHNDLKLDLFMRIAPELPLKKLIVGGLERVYEIGRQFRNEGIDLTHNPEFTSCEFYWAYADYQDLITVTEDLISGMVKGIAGGYKISYNVEDDDGVMKPVEVNFKPPFKCVEFIAGIEEAGGFKIPENLESDSTNEWLVRKVNELGLKMPEPPTTTKLLDKLCEHFIEKRIVHPTFVTCHPAIMSPLAKYHRSKPYLTERFELFVLGKEVCNAYTELNNPLVQRERFEAQAKDKDKGDDEAQLIDEDFCQALEYGLPPTAGWGLGVDRLTMFLTGALNIKEVLLFPAMRPEVAKRDGNDESKEDDDTDA